MLVSCFPTIFDFRELTKTDDELQLFQNLPHNVYDKTHLLAETVKQVVQDHLSHQLSGERPHYPFEYWERILYLTGALEPTSVQDQQDDKDGQSIHSIRRTSTQSSMDEWNNPQGMIDWLHRENPLNATETLTEWLLVNLVDRLEAELVELRIKVGAVTDHLGKEEEASIEIC